MDNRYSVLMSVYNKENPGFFQMSIDSILNQTLKPDEIVIVKDGKLTKDLEKIIDFYVNKESKLFVIVPLLTNRGLGLALNEGLKKCKNELVARMDTDDIALPNRCELQVKAFQEHEELSIVGSSINEFYEDPKNIVSSRVVPLRHEEILKFSKRRSPFNHPTVMYRKSAVIGCGGYRDIKRKEDFDLFVRMLNMGCIGMNIKTPLLLFRANRDNFARRKSWVNCKGSIMIMLDFWKKGYSGFIDFFVVSVAHIAMFICPEWLIRWASERFLRKRI